MMQQPGEMAPPAPGKCQRQQYPPQQAQAPQFWQKPYGAAPANAAPVPGGADEDRTLWIGGLQRWMDEKYLVNCFDTGELVSTKIIRNKLTNISRGYGFLEFRSRAVAELVLQSYNGCKIMPNSGQSFRMSWDLGARDNTPEHTIFVGDLAPVVTNCVLLETFKKMYSSVEGAKVITNMATGRSEGYGFVIFGDEGEQQRALTEMNGVYCCTRQMRVGPAAKEKPMSAAPTVTQSDNSPEHTIVVVVGGFAGFVTDNVLYETYKSIYQSVKWARLLANLGKTGRSLQTALVSFGDESEKKQASADTIFVGDVPGDIVDHVLQESFQKQYRSNRGFGYMGPKLGKGYVYFGEKSEKEWAVRVANENPNAAPTQSNHVSKETFMKQYLSFWRTELNANFAPELGTGNVYFLEKSENEWAVRVANENPKAAPTQSADSSLSLSCQEVESDPNNTKICVGDLDPSVTEDNLKQVFSEFGELAHVLLPMGKCGRMLVDQTMHKQCGFVQFVDRSCAEKALSALDGTMLGGQNIRLSWALSPLPQGCPGCCGPACSS